MTIFPLWISRRGYYDPQRLGAGHLILFLPVLRWIRSSSEASHIRRQTHIPAAILSVLFLQLVLFFGVRDASAQWPNGLVVEETFHNLTVPATASEPDMFGLVEDFGQVCIYCHGPHNAAQDVPLWNRPTPSASYRMPDQDDFDMIIDSQPTGNALLCLSCHDGTIGLDEIVNMPAGYTGPGPAGTSIEECEDCHEEGDYPDFEGVYFDTDLRDQHPFSMVYDPSRNNDFNTIAEVEAAGLVFFDGKMQCLTCHEPHSAQYKPFLRIPNVNRSLCFVCHKIRPGENTPHFW